MVVHWHLTFLWWGQVGFPMHLYGENVENFKRLLLWSLWANVAQISCGAFLGQGNERLLKWLRSKMAAMPIYGKNLWKSSSPEQRLPWGWIFAQIIGDGRSTKVAKMLVVHWRLTFLRQGQVCFLMHLYGPYTFVWKKWWSFQMTPLKPLG